MRLRVFFLPFLLGLMLALPAAAQAAITVPQGFQDRVAFGANGSLTVPTQVVFADDGRVFVAEKSGVIKEFDSLMDTTPTVVADLRTEVYNYGDRGLLSIALDPGFTTGRPYLYALYAYDAEIGQTAPKWGNPGDTFDDCPTPPGGFQDGCVTSGRLVKLTISGNSMTNENVLINDWCSQFSSHSVDSLAFGPDGKLWASGGDASDFGSIDYGQHGYPSPNPCGDPMGANPPVTSEGGSFRSQDIITSDFPGGMGGSDPTGLDGSIIRVDPDTGDALASNPEYASSDANNRRIVATGFRNPFRFAFRPGAPSTDLWVGNVGWGTWEEIDHAGDPVGNPSHLFNSGWPCYEGPAGQDINSYSSLGTNLCQYLYDNPSLVDSPFYTYRHGGGSAGDQHIVNGESCVPGTHGSALSALAFYGSGGNFPATYGNGALYFADYARNCIWVMPPTGPGGLPNPNDIRVFAQDESFDPDTDNPTVPAVDIVQGPDGAIYWVDIFGGKIHRISYSAGNQTPLADASATTPTDGTAPLQVHLDATRSSDPDSGDTLSYSWDLDGDGTFGDATGPTVDHSYPAGPPVVASVRVTDNHGASDVASVTISPGQHHPTAHIDTPAGGFNWKVGDTINFSGGAGDAEDGTVAPGGLQWTVQIRHCPGGEGCHTHFLTGLDGVAGGSVVGPDHEYPSYLRITLTATDSSGLRDTVTRDVYPSTRDVTLDSKPRGIPLTLGEEAGNSRRTQTVIAGSHLTLSAPASATVGGADWNFSGWSDGGDRVHQITVNDDTSLRADYTTSATCTADPAPTSAITSLKRARRALVLTGSAADKGCSLAGVELHPAGVAKVAIYVARLKGRRCQFLDGRHFGRATSCSTGLRLIDATGTASWQRRIAVKLKRGRYLAGSIATDNFGHTEAPSGPAQRGFRVR